MSEESHTPSDILVFAENRFLRLFCLWSARLHRDANERERAKIRTINLSLNRCRWAFLLIIMIINFAQAVDGIPSPPRPTHRAQKNIKRKTKTRKISLNGSSSSSNRAHTFARNEFILQHSRCLFIRLNNIFLRLLLSLLWDDAHQQQRQHRRLFFLLDDDESRSLFFSLLICVQIRD